MNLTLVLNNSKNVNNSAKKRNKISNSIKIWNSISIMGCGCGFSSTRNGVIVTMDTANEFFYTLIENWKHTSMTRYKYICHAAETWFRFSFIPFDYCTMCISHAILALYHRYLYILNLCRKRSTNKKNHSLM